jgi:hypothetical protein
MARPSLVDTCKSLVCRFRDRWDIRGGSDNRAWPPGPADAKGRTRLWDGRAQGLTEPAKDAILISLDLGGHRRGCGNHPWPVRPGW